MPVGGDCSGLDGGGIDACYTFWLVGLMAVVLIHAVIVICLGVILYIYGSEACKCLQCFRSLYSLSQANTGQKQR